MVVLADTSVWIDHFRKAEARLVDLLDQGLVVVHPFVIGELVLGHVPRLGEILADLRELPRAVVASADEVVEFVMANDLAGRGIGYVDAHLLAAARLTPEASLWTRDRRLDAIARTLSLAATCEA